MALSDLGRVYHQAGHLEEAVKTYRQTIRLRPDLAQASNSLGEALAAQGKKREAIDVLRAALDIDSTLVETRNALGHLYAAEGLLEEAIRQWEKVLWLAPEHPAARTWIQRARKHLSAR
jgi:cytochrome c-type biogenesis protein CcmH/NrfG